MLGGRTVSATVSTTVRALKLKFMHAYMHALTNTTCKGDVLSLILCQQHTCKYECTGRVRRMLCFV